MPDKYGNETMEEILNANAANERAKKEALNIENAAKERANNQNSINMSDDDLWSKMTPEDLDRLWESIYNVEGVKKNLDFKFKSATDEKYWPNNVFKTSKEKGKTLKQVLETLVKDGIPENKIPKILNVLRKKMNEILYAKASSPTYDPIVDVIEAVPVINRGNGNIPRAQAVAISNLYMPERDMQVARVVSDDDDDYDDEQMTTMEYNPNITIKDDYFGGTRRRRPRKPRKSRKTRKTKRTRKQRRIRFRR